MTTTDRRFLPVPQLWDPFIDSYVSRRRFVAGRSENCVKADRSTLCHLARWVPEGVGPWEVTAAMLEAYSEAQRWAPASRKVKYTQIRQFYEDAVSRDYLPSNPARVLPRIRQEKHHPRPAPDWVVARAIKEAPTLREVLMIRLSDEMGMRRAEVACAHTDDLLRDGTGGWEMVVHGKGSKDRVLPVPDSLGDLLGSRPPGYLFPAHGKHLSARWVGQVVAGLLPGAWTQHSLRHRFGTRLYEDTRDIVLVQEALGHEDVATTMRYVEFRDRTGMRAAMNRISPRAA